MESYRKIIKKRIGILEEELEKKNKEVSGLTASMETILRESAMNISDQSERTGRFQDTFEELTAVMTEKEFLEQRLYELQVIRDMCKKPGEQ